MRCAACDMDNPDAAAFCDRCGASLVLACTACGTAARPGARFCGRCGTGLTSSPSSEPDRAAIRAAAGERKMVTVLFADLRGSTALIDGLDPEAAMTLLDPAVEAMREAVQRFGGTVNREQGDGIMALFGAPLASEDHAVRACLAGQAIISGIAALDATLEVRVGLHSGDAVIRPVGNDPNDYDAVGVTAHLAHRLEQLAAPRSICLSARTALLARGAVDLERMGARQIAGLAEPVEIFRLISAHERPGWEMRSAAGAMTGFVGREAELRALDMALGRAWLGRGQVVTVIGEAGIGKSRLAHEFTRRLPAGGWMVVSASAIGHAEGTPYRLAAEILRAWLGVSRSDERADVARKLAQSLALLGVHAPADAAPLESLLDLPVADPVWAEMSPDWQRDRLLPALAMVILRESAVAPVLLLVEDLHWADPQSIQMVEALVERMAGARAMLLITKRPLRRAAWSALMQRSYCTILQLGPLDPAATDRLLGLLLGSSQELAELRARIVARADGTPLFLEEFCRALVEQGVVVAEQLRPARRMTRMAEDITIPASVQAILATRIDQLPPDERRLLQLAAIIGKDVPGAVLAAVAGQPAPVLKAQLDALVTGEFLYTVLPTDAQSGADYTFKHALTQTVAYDGMLRRQRRDLHAKVLTSMTMLAADRAEELTETLCVHALRGEVWDSAVRLARRAGVRANARSAYQQAIEFHEQAITALAHLPEQADTLALAIDLRLGLRVALGPASEYQRVLTVLDEAREIALRLGGAHRIAQIEVSRCIAMNVLAMVAESVATGAAALHLAQRLGDPAILLNATYAYGMALWFQGDLERGAAVMAEHLHLAGGPLRARNTGTSGTASVLLLVCKSMTLALRGDLDQAHALACEASEIAEITKKPYDICYSRVAGGFAHLMAGDMAAAANALETAMTTCRQAKVAVMLPSIARFLGPALAATGRRAEGRVLMHEAMRASEGSDALTVWCGLGLAQVLEPAEAIEALAGTLALAERLGLRPALALGLRRMGELRIATGDLGGGHDALQRSLSLARLVGMAREAASLEAQLSQNS